MDKRYYEEKEYAQGRYANNVNIHNMETCDTLTENQHLAIHSLRATRHVMHVDGAKALWEGEDWVVREVGGYGFSGNYYEGEINTILREAGLPTIEFLTIDFEVDDIATSELLSEYPEYWCEEGESRDDAFYRYNAVINEIIEENDIRIRDYLVAIDMEHGTTYAPVCQGEDIHRVNALNLKEATDMATPAATLEALAENKNIKVRRAVADNPNTPSEILKTLAKDEDAEVRCSAFINANTVPSRAMKLVIPASDQKFVISASDQKFVISASDLKEAKDEKDIRDAKAPEQEQKRQKNHEQGLE